MLGLGAEEEHEQSHAERHGDQVQRAEDEHQLRVGRHQIGMYPGRGSSMTTSRAWPAAMAGLGHPALGVSALPVEGARSTRRLRKQGLVPGVVYGGGDE